jgi:uncharacterized membrane protein
VDLIVVGFQGRYRAAQVLTELRQREMHFFDLDQAITVSWEDRRNFIVQQSVNVSREEGAYWSHFWGSFIKATMYQPFTERLSLAASKVASREAKAADEDLADSPAREWWVRELGISDDFIRDVGALVGPGESAIIALATNLQPSAAISFLRERGGSVVYTSLNIDQTKKVDAVLTGHDRLLGGKG